MSSRRPGGDFYVSRVHTGLCEWIDHEHLIPDLEVLRKSDPFAFADLEGLRRDSEARGGLAGAFGRTRGKDYRAPLMYLPPRVADPPWLGELKITGKPRPRKHGTRLERRLYFGEPSELSTVVVACGLGSKDPLDDHVASKQDDQIRTAMERFKHYCRLKGFT